MKRNDLDFSRGKFRLRGDTLEIQPAYEEMAIRIEFFGQIIERIIRIDPLTGECLQELDRIDIFPAKHFVTGHEKMLKAIGGYGKSYRKGLVRLKNQGSCLRLHGWNHAPTTILR